MAAPLVSVIIPCYQHGAFLAGAVDSALGQTHAPLEVIVVDDGSTDETAKVAESYGDRVRYLRKAHGGVSSARNFGAAAATGEFFAFLDADDMLAPDYVSECLRLLNEDESVGFVYTQQRWFGRKEKVTDFPDWDAERLRRHNYINPAILIRRQLARSVPYDETLRQGWEDWDLYLHLAERGVKGRLLDRPLVSYRKHDPPDSMVDRLDADPLLRMRVQAAIYRRHPALFPRRQRTAHALRRVATRVLPARRRRLVTPD